MASTVAMKGDPMLQSLRGGDWITPDLKEQFASNEIFTKGLQNPKCIAAMQLMQSDPKEAERRFRGDPGE